MRHIIQTVTPELTLLEMLALALTPMPYAVIGDRLFSMSAIDYCEPAEGGGLQILLRCGEEITLNVEETKEFKQFIKDGLDRARSQQLQSQIANPITGQIRPS